MTQITELDLNIIDAGTHYTLQAHGSRFSFVVFENAGRAHVQVLHDSEAMFDPQPYSAETRQLLFADDDVLPFAWWAECDRDIFAIVLALAHRLTVRLELDPAAV